MKQATLSPWTIALFAAPIAISAQAADMPGVDFGDTLVIEGGRIAGVDPQDRVLWVQAPEGNVVVMEVGDAVENFKQIRVDDTVNLEYYEGVAFYIGGKGEPPDADAGEVLATAPKGIDTGSMVEAVHVAATVEAIDQAKRTLTLKGPEGNIIPLKVAKSVAAFDKLQVGEVVNASYAEALAISISAP